MPVARPEAGGSAGPSAWAVASRPLASQRMIRRHQRIAALLAAIPVVGVWTLRHSIENRGALATEIVATLLCVLVAGRIGGIGRPPGGVDSRSAMPRRSGWERVRRVALVAIVLAPLAAAWISPRVGAPVAREMAGLSAFGALALALAVGSSTSRNLSMSMVSSGFLALFTVSISDDPRSVLLAIGWIAICLWHLITAHWQRLETCMPERVRRGWGVRPTTLVAGVAVFAVTGWVVQRWVGPSRLLSVGVMPTSGGSKWSDPSARSGVGDGAAVVAAREHAESFGPVESDLFLESTEMSLFDMFNDMIGESKIRTRSEKSQDLTPERMLQSHARQAESHGGGQSFSTRRERPKRHPTLRDVTGEEVLQWVGPTGIRLATNRYEAFDGVEWSRDTADAPAAEPVNPSRGDPEPTLEMSVRDRLPRRELAGETWFLNPLAGPLEGRVEFSSGAVKVIRLDSTRIPAPMLTAAVHIRDVIRDDFFGLEADGSLAMPGRTRIPPLSVIRTISHRVTEDELLEPERFDLDRTGKRAWGGGAWGAGTLPDTDGTRAAAGRARRWLGDVGDAPQTRSGQETGDISVHRADGSERGTPPFEQLKHLVDRLRSEFVLDRDLETVSGDPLAEFLERGRGGEHMFATAAAVMGRAIGFQTRLVTGFYVRPSRYDIAAAQTPILAEDAHVWIEVRLADGRWIAMEPSPGYEPPDYRASWWLVTRRLAAAHWHRVASGLACFGLLVWTRLLWSEPLLYVVWLVTSGLPCRFRMRTLMWVLEHRARLAGHPRPSGIPQRDWLLTAVSVDRELSDAARAVCDDADRLVFGGDRVIDPHAWRKAADRLARGLTIGFFKRGGPQPVGGFVFPIGISRNRALGSTA